MAIQSVRVPRASAPHHPTQEAQPATHPIPSSSPASTRLQVLRPGNGDIVTAGQPVLIGWQTSCVPGLLLYCIQLSTDGGVSYRWDISPLLDGKECQYIWIPTEELVTPAARIRVVAINWAEATSDGCFMILPGDRRHSITLPSDVS